MQQNGHSLVRDRLALYLRPHGLVFDDEPDPLLRSIEARLEQYLGCWRPEFEVVPSSPEPPDVISLVADADFVLLDGKLDGAYGGMSGLDIGLRIVEGIPDIPMIFYSAHPEDLRGPGRQRSWTDSARPLMERENVTWFNKGDLFGRRVYELSRALLGYGGNAMRRRLHKDGQGMDRFAGSRAVREDIRRYRIVDYDGRRSVQQVVPLEGGETDCLYVPTRYLRAARVGGSTDYVSLRVIEFDRGQVLSYFDESTIGGSGLPRSVRRILETGDAAGDRL